MTICEDHDWMIREPAAALLCRQHIPEVSRRVGSLHTVAGARLAHDVPDVDLDRALLHSELVRDRLVRLALVHVAEDHDLARSQRTPGPCRRTWLAGGRAK